MSTINDLIDSGAIQSIADEVWASLLGQDEVLVPLEGLLGDDAVSSWVEVTGPWCGAVVVTCGAGTAEDFTRALLGEHAPDELEVEDLEDAFCELANVLGGNVKGLLPGPSSLSLPQFGFGIPEVPDLDDSCRIDVLWRDQPLSISVQGVATAALDAFENEVQL